MTHKKSLRDAIYDIVSRIPKGKVSTYGRVALMAGGGGPRYVGWCLHHNPDHEKIPCHRVVSAQGKLAKTFAFGGIREQEKILLKEGITCKNGKVVNFDTKLY